MGLHGGFHDVQPQTKGKLVDLKYELGEVRRFSGINFERIFKYCVAIMKFRGIV